MRPTAAQHPTNADLAAFALGKLDHSATEWVGRHLEECPACRAFVASSPADSLVQLLRKADAARVSSPHGATPSLQGSATGGVPPAPALDPADLPPALRDHPRYRVIRQLGQGGMGVVYQAEHRLMERLVAVKVINHTLLDHPEVVERFNREVRAAAKLDHPNIVKAFDAEQVGDLQLLAMEFVEGKSLADVLAKKGSLPVAHACHYVRQAALGLQHAHERGMVHRDLKPHNLMLTAKGVVKILDFGLAKLASERRRGNGLTRDNTMMGTPEYIAPEQAQDTKAADIRADIYSLGCTLFCLLAGRPPFTGEDWLTVVMAHLQEEPPALEDFRPDVPSELAALVARMLAKAPAQRPQTPKEIAEALAPFAKPGAKSAKVPAAEAAVPLDTPADDVAPFAGLAAMPLKLSGSGHKANDRRRWLIPVVAGVAAMLLGVGLWAGGILTTQVKTPEGTIVLTVNQPGAEILVDGSKVTVSRAGSEPVDIQVPPGKRTLQISKGGFKVESRELTLDPGGREQLLVQLVPVAVAEAVQLPPIVTPPPGPATPINREAGVGYGLWSIDGQEVVQESLGRVDEFISPG